MDRRVYDIERDILHGLLVRGEAKIFDYTFKKIKSPGTPKVRLSKNGKTLMERPISDVMAVISHYLYLMNKEIVGIINKELADIEGGE